jgi:uncharacterized membrane protein HdeD (DUF308 family)
MSEPSVELSRLSFVLFLRGMFLILLSAVAIRWPAPALLIAMVAAGGVVGSLGIFEVAAASVSEALSSTRVFLLGHGLVSVAFGVLTATIPVVSVPAATTLSLVWLLLYLTYTLLLTARLWYRHRVREALLLWSAITATCAATIAFFSPPTVNALLYAGALYAGILGIAQLVAAAWIHRGNHVLTDRAPPFLAAR